MRSGTTNCNMMESKRNISTGCCVYVNLNDRKKREKILIVLNVRIIIIIIMYTTLYTYILIIGNTEQMQHCIP
jgi:hypothetical protein